MNYKTIQAVPISGALGAEIRGVSLADPLSDECVAEIRQAFLEHLVIFFRDQSLTPKQHLAFARRMWLVSFLLRIHCYLTDIRNYRNIAFLPEKNKAY